MLKNVYRHFKLILCGFCPIVSLHNKFHPNQMKNKEVESLHFWLILVGRSKNSQTFNCHLEDYKWSLYQVWTQLEKKLAKLAHFHIFGWLGWTAWVKLHSKHNVMTSHYAKFRKHSKAFLSHPIVKYYNYNNDYDNNDTNQA